MNKIYTKYSPTKNNRLMNVKKNCIFIHNSNSLKHELCKCVGALMIHRWGDIKFSNGVIEAIWNLDDKVKEEFGIWDKDPTDFLTEGWKDSKRRVDLVNLRNGDEIEFETKKSEKKEGAITVYI